MTNADSFRGNYEAWHNKQREIYEEKPVPPRLLLRDEVIVRLTGPRGNDACGLYDTLGITKSNYGVVQFDKNEALLLASFIIELFGDSDDK